MTNLEKVLKDYPNLSREEIIKRICPNTPFIDENMNECENYCGIENNWCIRHWECEYEE